MGERGEDHKVTVLTIEKTILGCPGSLKQVKKTIKYNRDNKSEPVKTTRYKSYWLKKGDRRGNAINRLGNSKIKTNNLKSQDCTGKPRRNTEDKKIKRLCKMKIKKVTLTLTNILVKNTVNDILQTTY